MYDYRLLISKYLQGKDVTEDDSLNVELFLEGDLSGWRFANVPAPSLEQLHALHEQVEAEQNQIQVNNESLRYLADTDWLVTRAMENPNKPVPQEILEARQAARDRIVK